MTKHLNVAELFAGVGGFRVGFERVSKSFFKTVYANQWEPSTKIQHAYNCYVHNFGESDSYQFHDNTDISIVATLLQENPRYIKDKINLLVGGFPCQDYSVATTKAKGIQGKKGVLWWEMAKIIKIKKPDYLLLENVDRLLMSPGKDQRGRDFLIMLSILNEYGYDVEWRVVNAAEYGFVQRRKRVFIFAYKRKSNIAKSINYEKKNFTVLTKELKIIKDAISEDPIDISQQTLQSISDNGTHHFYNYGNMRSGIIRSMKVSTDYSGPWTYLEDIVEKGRVDDEYYLSEDQMKRIFAAKDGGKKERIAKNGFRYFYSEGKMSHYDNIPKKPGRTMLTSEGTINRSTHIIKDKNGNYRFLLPTEAETLNGFEKNWTESIPFKNKRYFMMGNALVTDVVEQIGKSIRYFENKN